MAALKFRDRSGRVGGAVCSALGMVLALVLLNSCQSASPSFYISPRITGRVIDAETQQPISDVRIKRETANQSYRPIAPPKGGEKLEDAPLVIRTGTDGTFVLNSERDLGLFQRQEWFSVTLSFERSGYERALISYTLSNSTNTPSGEPLVKAGNILLIPISK